MEVVFGVILIIVFLATISLMVFSSLFQTTYEDTPWTNKRAMKLIVISVLRALVTVISFIILFLVFFGVMLFVGMYLIGEIENDYIRYVIGLIALLLEIFLIGMGMKCFPNNVVDKVDRKMKEWVKK